VREYTDYWLPVVVPSNAKNTLKSLCAALPSGRTTGASGGLGGVGSVGGGMEMVLNYNSGQISGFYFGGGQIGWAGGVSGSVYSGYVWGLNDSNSNYGGGFTGANAGAGIGGFAASTSGGLTGGGNGLKPDGSVNSAGLSFGGSLVGALSGGLTATNYTDPIQMGSFWGFDANDWSMYVAKQVCKAAGF